LSLAKWQQNMECTAGERVAISTGTFDPDSAPVPFNNATRNGKSETQPAPLEGGFAAGVMVN
jgi:hypothetical protein